MKSPTTLLVALTLTGGLVVGTLPPPALAGSAEYGRAWRLEACCAPGATTTASTT